MLHVITLDVESTLIFEQVVIYGILLLHNTSKLKRPYFNEPSDTGITEITVNMRKLDFVPVLYT